MVVGATGDNLVTAGDELVAHGACVGHHLHLVFFIFGLHCLEEGNGFGCDAVLKRATLDTGEYACVEDCAHLLDFALGSCEAPGVVEVLAQQDDAAARAAEGLVGGGCYDVCIFHRVLEEACGDEAGSVCHVYPQQCANLVCYCTHALVIPLA